jgi:putative transposase
MQIGNRFYCNPTELQQQVLLQWIGAQRFIYNAKVQEDRYLRAFARKYGGKHAIDQQYAQFRAESPWMAEIPGVVLRNGAVRWKTAYARYFKKLSKRPSIHKKTGEQSVWLTNELFTFVPVNDADGVITGYRLMLGTKKHPVGELAITAHRAFQPAASIHVSVHNGRWHVSFNYDDGVLEPSDKDTTVWLMQFGETELLTKTFGGDRGIAIPLAGNHEERFDLGSIQKKRIEKKQAAAKRWQRKIARRPKGSANRRKAIARVGKLRAYEARVRSDFAHQASHTLAEDSKYLLYVFEALGVQCMTKKPKAKPDPDRPGHYLKNQARAKAGLNSAILKSCWGRTRMYLAYKARRKGKLLIDVSPHHTSQECSRCGHIHPDNRVTQERFVCQACTYSENADHNAAKVIARRGVQLLLSGGWTPKEKTRCALRKEAPMIGADCAESPALPATPVETTVSRGRRKTAARMSMTQEREAPPSISGAD